MNGFLNPRNGTSLTNTIDVTAQIISLFQEEIEPTQINGIFYTSNKYRNIRTD